MIAEIVVAATTDQEVLTGIGEVLDCDERSATATAIHQTSLQGVRPGRAPMVQQEIDTAGRELERT